MSATVAMKWVSMQYSKGMICWDRKKRGNEVDQRAQRHKMGFGQTTLAHNVGHERHG